MGMSPMGPHHGYATPVTPASVHTAHPHNGGLSPMNDVKTLCYGRSVYDTGKLLKGYQKWENLFERLYKNSYVHQFSIYLYIM